MEKVKKIEVTRTFLPPKKEYQQYLNKIWATSQLTNQGPLLLEFEDKMKHYLNVSNFHFVTNGTTAIQLALNALDITSGDIITTPFSYVATTSAILWERCKPVFVDIESDMFCIDPCKIEQAITKDTKAILAVHVFGYPCDVEKIEMIARKHGLKVIYDGAHAFGVKYKGKSLLSYGDISTCSFHATKLFHTIEGGCVIPKDEKVNKKLGATKRFGHVYDDYSCIGINAKASEFQAAMGLCNFKYIDDIKELRRNASEGYDKFLKKAIQRPRVNKNVEYNYAYYPIILKSEEDLLRIVSALNNENIYPRRYFYPSLNNLSYLKNHQECLISEDISSRILCLPLYVGIKYEDLLKISNIINSFYV